MFDDLRFTFKSELDPMTNEPFEVVHTVDQFEQVADDQIDALFKLAAHHAILKTNDN